MIVHPRLTEKCPINLYPHQEDHVQKIWKLLVEKQVFSCLDTSVTGSGKTFSSLYLAWHLQKLYNTQVMIVAPSETSLNNKDGWKHHAKSIGIEIMEGITYTKLRGGRGKVSHPWLIPDRNDKKKWVASDHFVKKCQEGLFLIFDEFHHTKNASITHWAAASLVKAAKKYRSVCRVMLLSHTPGDKIDVIPQLLRMTGIITEKKLFRHVPFTTGEYEWYNYGLGELAKVCQKLDKKSSVIAKVENDMHTFSANRANGLCKELYETYIRDIITFAMPKPENKFQVNMMNAFLETDEKSLRILNDGIQLLIGAVGWNSVSQQVAPQADWDLANIGRGLKMIEKGKLNSIARYVLTESKKNPEKKFVICCGGRNIDAHDYLSSMLFKPTIPKSYQKVFNQIKKKFKLNKDVVGVITSFVNETYPAHQINGRVPKKERTKIVEKFQADDDDSWCLIVSPGTGSESLSFHDKYGGRPREMFIIPDFFFSRTVQALGRINRVGMKSNSKGMIVYSKEGALETKILNSMIKKSKVARSLLAKDQEVIFPGELPYYIEGKKDINLEQQLNLLREN